MVQRIEKHPVGCKKHEKIEKVTASRDDKGKLGFSEKLVAGDKAFFKSNLDRFGRK
jgi:hypothetical protein